MLAPYIFFYCIAGITDMPTTTDIIWMKDIKSNNHSSILIFCNSSINLFFKKVICFFCCKFFFLWKCYSISYDLIPNFCCILGILCFIFSYENVYNQLVYPFYKTNTSIHGLIRLLKNNEERPDCKKIKEKYPIRRQTVREFKQQYTDRYKTYKDEMIKDHWRQ